jgi:hypothetical protein
MDMAPLLSVGWRACQEQYPVLGSARPPCCCCAGSRGIDATVAAELEALPATGFELATGVASSLVDLTRVRFRGSAVVATCAARAHHERHLIKMPGFEPVEDVSSSAALPAHQVAFGYENGTGPLRTAGTTFQAIQVRHLLQKILSGPDGVPHSSVQG